jgi:hypothetical protein
MPMQSVSRFEANLLRLLYFFLRQEPPERAIPLVEQRHRQPPCLSRGAVRLVQDALGKGCPHLLIRLGAWRNERHLRNEQVVEGRLWQRTPPRELGLRFSRHTLEFLLWITAVKPADKDNPWQPREEDLTPGDLLLLFFAHERLRETPTSLGFPQVRTRAPYAQHGLCWLAYPEDYGEARERAQPNFAPWTTGLGSCILEALQPELAKRWIAIEGGKEQTSNPQTMRQLGEAQDRVLSRFLDACEQAGRMDLARFLLVAGSHLLGPHANAGMWIGGLNTQGLRLADRATVYQAAMTYLRHFERLARWERQARGVGYFDEGYHASQLWKADWDHYQGDTLAARAHQIVRQIDPMRQVAEPARSETQGQAHGRNPGQADGR